MKKAKIEQKEDGSFVVRLYNLNKAYVKTVEALSRRQAMFIASYWESGREDEVKELEDNFL